MRLRRFMRQLHRWLGLLVAAQVLLWVCGGLIMSALRLDEVRGDDRAARVPVPALDPAAIRVAPAELLQGHAGATAVTLATLQGRAVYRVTAAGGVTLVDAASGSVLSPIPRELAETIARADYAGDAPIAGVDWIDVPATEYRGRPLPLWRVRFADDRNTALYVSAATGEISARRNDLWRVFDFVWMLHIMDYDEREDFNHPLLLATAASALLFVLSGLAMLLYSFAPRRKAAASSPGSK